MLRREPLEHVGAERRGRRDRDPPGHAQPRTMRGRRLAERLAPRLGRRAVDDQDAVEVVGLVLGARAEYGSSSS